MSATASPVAVSCEHKSSVSHVDVNSNMNDNSTIQLDCESVMSDNDSTFIKRDSTAGCGADFIFNKGAGLLSLRRILSSGKTSNV